MPPVLLCQCRDGLEAHFLQALLAAEDIPSSIVGESLEQLIGSLPLAAGRPQLWIDSADASRATPLIANARSHNHPITTQPAWQCPHCSELIEGQFSECWKCQTPRPTADVSSSSAGESTLDFDLPCQHCHYNLRGLIPTSRCPECGHSIPLTLLATRHTTPDIPDPRPLQSALRYVASSNPAYPSSAILFLLNAYADHLDLAGPSPAPESLLHSIRQSALDHFHTPARALQQFTQWSLHTTTDLTSALSFLSLPPMPSQTLSALFPTTDH
ncbi:MAG TPA: DUF2007 domain-containing protein [Tepidisphaeraceae bacterium]|nr:DUF2007 domain-containing protein [Tepidisphaeraceae bacterium]